MVVSLVCVLPVMGWPPMVFRPSMGLCSPAPFGEANPTFAVGYITVSLCAPLCIVTGVNIKITSIAKHHRVSVSYISLLSRPFLHTSMCVCMPMPYQPYSNF